MEKKSNNFIRYFLSALVLMLCIVFIPNLDAHASSLESSYVGDDIPSNTTTYAEGISPNKSGYMVYVADQNGNPVSPDAKFVSSTSYTFNRGSEAVWSCNARLGGYSINQNAPIKLNAAWGAPFYFSSGFQTRESDIKSWFATTDADGVTNAYKVIQGYWGDEYAESWVRDGYYLVLEPIYEFRMWYKYSIKVVHPTNGTLVEGEYQSKAGAPILVGNVPGLAYNANAFLSSFSTTPVERYFSCGDHGYIVESRTYYRGFTKSGMSSGYARAFPRMEYLNRQIGSVMAGSAGSSYLTCAQLTGSTGWGMLAMSANELAGGVSGSTYTESVAPPSDYDGTLYTLTSAGGSSSSGGGIGSFSGGGSGDTTYLGSGYGADRCAIGDLYAENCATGDEPYALADRLKSGMSYEGSVPPVVFSGTSYDLAVDNSMAILPSMLTVDPSTFPHVDISSSPESSYTSYLSTIRGSLSPSISLNYRGSSVDTYSGGSLESTPVIGGVADTKTYRIKRVCTLNQANCSSSGSTITWEVSGDYNNLSLKFAQVFYNNAYCAASSGSSILENTDLMRAFWVSSDTYVAGLKADGTLERYWNDQFEAYCVSKGNQAGNLARSAWEAENPVPEVPDEPVRSDYETLSDYEDAMEDFEDASDARSDWVSEGDAVWRSAYDATYNHHLVADASSFNCRYETPNAWVFNYYYCSPIMQRLYGVHDKLPIDDGPARGGELWDEAWKVSFSLTVQNTAPLGSDVLGRMITYMPLAGTSCTDVGSTPSVSYYVSSAHITNTDFLLPDATSMDMR